MLQVLKYVNTPEGEAKFRIIGGADIFKFFAKRAGYLLLFIYSTIFIAAIEPFAGSKTGILVYCAGGILTVFTLIRFCNHLVKYIQYSKGSITVKADKIICAGNAKNIEINAGRLKRIEINFLGNMVFHSDQITSFPLMFISRNDKDKFLLYFDDAAPGRTSVFAKIYDFADALFIAFILAMNIREYIVQNYYIPSGSMENTLLIGDHLLVEKITYGPVIPKMAGMDKAIHLSFLGMRDIRRDDIIIFRSPSEPDKDFIKRCIALPGDELHIKDDSVWLNGKKVKEPFIKGVTNYDYFKDKKLEGIVPKGSIVVLGDNRGNSSDSRAFGYLPVERVKGRAFIRYWNIKQIRSFDFSGFGLIR